MIQKSLLQTWGFCAPCAAWFAIPSDTVRALVAARCPGCEGSPERLEQRHGDLVISLDVDEVSGGTPDAPLSGVA